MHKLHVTIGKTTHVLIPAWDAPYFVVSANPEKPEQRPVFMHCDNLAHARTHLALGGVLFNSQLERIEL